MPIKIIGAGLDRTGTMSTKSALQILGYKTHHMFDIYTSIDHELMIQQWVQAYKFKANGETAKVKEILLELLKDYDATLAAPACNFYKELSEMYPNAVILLNIRDSSEDYAKSVVSTIGQLMKHQVSFIGKSVHFLQHIGENSFWQARDADIHANLYLYEGQKSTDFDSENFVNIEYLKEFYEYWNSKVENKIIENRRERLLKFNVKEGWEPLCRILKINTPSSPFPKINDGNDMRGLGVKVKLFHLFLLSWFVLPGYYAYRSNWKFTLGSFLWGFVIMKLARKLQSYGYKLHADRMANQEKEKLL